MGPTSSEPKWTQRAALTSLSSGSERLRTLVSVWGPQPGPVDREDQSPTHPEHSTLAHGGCSLRACVNTHRASWGQLHAGPSLEQRQVRDSRQRSYNMSPFPSDVLCCRPGGKGPPPPNSDPASRQ